VRVCTQSARKLLAQISLNVGKIKKPHSLSAASVVLVDAISAISILESQKS
jgi:mRNA-degrading endonuclease toxin of MazEF toxin-antitoxin module